MKPKNNRFTIKALKSLLEKPKIKKKKNRATKIVGNQNPEAS